MKCTLAFSAVIGLSLTGCDTMTRPISSGSFDPLSPPGSENKVVEAAGPSFSAGQFVRSSMDNTSFFKSRPKGNADADRLLTRGTSMKVISNSDSYVQVELDSGEIGYVPAILLEDPKAMPSAPLMNPNEYQVYPPLENFAAPVMPSEQPPEGAIPTVIDPEAPVLEIPVPVVPSTIELPPLPPNGEELQAELPKVEKPEAEVTPKLEE